MKLYFLLFTILLFVDNIFSQDFVQFQELDKEYNTNIGSVVNISYNYAIIGNPSANVCNSSAIIYKKKLDNTWEFFQEIKAPNTSNFGKNVLISENYAFVCEGDNLSAGSVYVYKLEGNSFIYSQKLEANIPQIQSNFGFSIDIDTVNNFLAISATFYDSKGKVFIYKLSNNNWQFSTSISESVNNANCNFGYSLKIEDNKLIISAPFENANGFESNGKIYYYEYSNENLWTIKQTIISNNVGNSQHLGISVDFNNNILTASAPSNSTLASNSGCVYIFNLIENQWIQTQILYNPNALADSYFGTSITLNQDYLVVNSPYNNVFENDSYSGACFIYKNTNDVFSKTQKIYPEVESEAGLFFGKSVSICDSSIIIGMPGNTYQNVYFFNSPVPFISEQPQNISDVTATDIIGFNVIAERAESYKWQISYDNGNTFLNANNDNVYINSGSDNLFIYTGNYMNNLVVRCEVSNQYGSSISDNATINLIYDKTLGLVYPNPSNGNFSVKLFNQTSDNVEVSIFDMNKNLIYKDLISQTQLEINRPELPRGIYLIALRSGNQKEIHKMMIIN